LKDLGLGGVVCNVAFGAYLRDDANWEPFTAVVRACAELGMRVWIYDEDGYPSGAAGGIVLENRPELEARELVRHPDGRFEVRACYEYTHACNNFYCARRYANLLDAGTTPEFLRVTHEAYQARVGEYMGTTIEAFFTDEPSLIAIDLGQLPAHVREKVRVVDPVDETKPQLPCVPWCPDLAERYRERFGHDLQPHLPSLFGGDSEADRSVRRRFWSLVADLFASRYFGGIREWCAAHGVAASGHTIWEEFPLHQVALDGNALRLLMNMDIPGLDILNSDPGAAVGHDWMTAAFPASAALWNGGRKIMTEVSDFSQKMSNQGPASLEWMYGTAAWQAAWGVTEFTLYYRPEDRDPAAYRDYSAFVGRLNAVLRAATWVPDVLIYYPIRDLWEEYCPVAERLSVESQSPRARGLVQSFAAAGQALTRRQTPAAIVDHDLLAEGRVAEDGMLEVRGRRFRALVLPAGVSLPGSAAAVVDLFVARGGTVWDCGEAATDGDTLPGFLAPRVGLSPASNRVTVGCYRRDGRDVTVLVNTAPEPYAGSVAVPGDCEILDPASGMVTQGVRGEDGVRVTVPGYHAVILLRR
jgi:hypothetical protein